MRSIIDTPPFQRLRYLKQLGSAYFVFPGASHNRFEHSIGTCYLAGILIDRLHKDQPELGINERDITCIRVAALCHDLGHGPFSHMFDQFIHCTNKDWSHEKSSCMMLDYLLRTEDIPLDRNDFLFIQSIILGKPDASLCHPDKMFLYQIVANTTNSLDVDKLDYIARDSYALGVKVTQDIHRILHSARVINNNICYNHKDIFNIYELFTSRFSLHKRIYQHKTCNAIDHMISDVFKKADRALSISHSIANPITFLHMTDSILELIEHSIHRQDLDTARCIIERIRRRNLYKWVGSTCIPSSAAGDHCYNIESIRSRFDKDLQDDLIITKTKIHFGFGNSNPLDFIQFYTNDDINKAFAFSKSNFTNLIPQNFEECVIQCFCRTPSNLNNAKRTFDTLFN